MFMQVPSGVYCIVQRFGKDIGEMDPGLKILPAWYRIAYIVSKQSCTYDAPVINCPTSDNVRVSVDVVIVFNVKDPSKFIYRLGAKNFDDFLSGTVDEAIRIMVRKEDHKTVYSLRGERADMMLKLLNDKFQESGVHFSDVKITAVWLPDELAGYLESTTKYEKQMKRLIRQNEYETLEIRLASEMAIEEIRRETERVLVSEAGNKRRAELEFEQKSVKAEEDGRVAMIEAEGKMEADQVEVDGQLKRTRLELQAWSEEERAKATADKEAARIEALYKYNVAIEEAEYQMQEMEDEARILRFEAGTEERAQRLLVAKRKHDVDTREKMILTDLAENGNFNMIGDSGDTLVKAMMDGNLDKTRV